MDRKAQFYSRIFVVTTSLLLSIQSVFAINPPPEKPTLVTPLSFSNAYDEGSFTALIWNRIDRALWYNVYIQKDGVLFRQQWYRADEIPPSPAINTNSYPPGSYKWWVRAWEPSSGSGEWSENGAFTINCRQLNAPALQFPADNAVNDGFWLSSLSVQRDPTVTWAEIELTKDSIFYTRKWVEFPIRNNGILPADDPSGFNLVLPDGTYEWKARVWSPCYGPSLFSNPRTFIQQNSSCTGAPEEPFAININRLHFTSFDFAASNHPSANPQFSELTSYSQYYVRSVSTGQVVFNQWLYHDQYLGDFIPALKPGDYEIWVRGYNECGIGAWSEPPLVFTISEKPAVPVQNFSFRGHDCEGNAHAAWGVQAGIDWYQLYLAQDGKVLLNQWYDMSGSGPFEGVKIDYDENLPGKPRSGLLYFEYGVPTAGRNLDFYVRTYTHSRQYSGWEHIVVPQQFSDIAGPNISEIANNNGLQTIDWSDTNSIGRYHFWLTRDGKYYFDSYVECTGGIEDPRGIGWPEISGTLPSEWTPFFQLSPGNYSFWVRNVCGGYATPWSGPESFTVE